MMKKIAFVGVCISSLILVYFLSVCLPSEADCRRQFEEQVSYALSETMQREWSRIEVFGAWWWVPGAVFSGGRVNCIDWVQKGSWRGDEELHELNKCERIRRVSWGVLCNLSCKCDFDSTPCEHLVGTGVSKCTLWIRDLLLNIKDCQDPVCKRPLLVRFYREAKFTGLRNPIAGLQALVHNSNTSGTFQILSSRDISLFVWCLKSLQEMNLLMADDIEKYLATKEWHPMSRRGDGVILVQASLRDKGYEISADGIWGERSIEAMQDFQGSRGLVKTCFPDQRTLKELQVDPGEFYKKSVENDVIKLLNALKSAK